MAQHAWLDSLSEDWVSQSSSDVSQPQLPMPSSPLESTNPNNARHRASRIPRLNGANADVRRSQQQPHTSSPSALSERNQNHINIRAAQIGPSRLAHEMKSSRRGRHLSRSVSLSSAGSVVHNSVLQAKSQSTSPSKGRENAPEWKRRLVFGELDYGESRDLFSSAATGLENIFRPPQTRKGHSAGPAENEGHTINETTLPSSPPPYWRNRQDSFNDDNDEVSEQDRYDLSVQQQNADLPTPISLQPPEDVTADLSGDGAALTGETNRDESETQLDDSSLMSARKQQLLDESRKVSGQSIVRNEDFSPIIITRHSSAGGGVSFAPTKLPAHQLRKRLEILRRNQMILDSEPDNGLGKPLPAIDGAGDFEDTEEYAKNGGFLNLQRGEDSNEGSFFRHPFSPSKIMDTSEMLPESSLQASTPKQFPSIKTDRFVSAGGKQTRVSPASPSLPCAPHPSPNKLLQPASPKTSSPLKLFGPYDTFTNQTLLRRISQYENQHRNSSSCYIDETAVSQTPAGNAKFKPHDEQTGSPAPATGRPRVGSGPTNKFGAGELDDFEFEGDQSMSSSRYFHLEEKENMTPPRNRVPLAKPFNFDIHEDSPEGKSPIGRHNHRMGRSVSSAHHNHLRVTKSLDGLRSRSSTEPNRPGSSFPSSSKRDSSEGKRPRTSPSKDPTPKRRRTLHRSDIAYGLEERRTAIETVQSSHYTMQSAMTRDRRYTRKVEVQKLVNPNAPAVPNSLRRGLSATHQRIPEPRDRLPLAELSLTSVLGSATAPVSGDDTENIGANSSRKVSMKTQDFFDAAEEVMAMIRNKARPITGLASVEESEMEGSRRYTHDQYLETEDSYQESTQEPFSRPPSRDGQPVLRLPVRQEDPELVNQLKKYEEHDDSDDMLGQSIQSVGNLRTVSQRSYGTGSTNQHGHSPSQRRGVNDEGDVISDIPNVRLSRNPEKTAGNNSTNQYPSYNSQSSSGSSERSMPTGSSRGSDSRRLIAPDVVAQLIGNQVGNMVFDDVNKLWQKIKTRRPAMSIIPSEDSEDDPFASIADLTVDSTKEKRHLDLGAGKILRGFEEQPQRHRSRGQSSSNAGKPAEGAIRSEDFSYGSIQAHVETALEDDEEIDHEISLHEDRIQKTMPSRRKNLTITFSSPIASIIQEIPQRDSDDGGSKMNANLDGSPSSVATDSVKRGRYGKRVTSVSSMTAKTSSESQSRAISKNFSVENHAFVPRPVSRIDEQDENASGEQPTEPGDQSQVSLYVGSRAVGSGSEPARNPDLSVVVATPARAADIIGASMLGQYVGTFSLSPMSEFTVHQIDNSCALELSYVVGDQYLVTGDGSKKIMSKAVRSLVEKITEVEPYDPDWESISELDLSNKQLDTLHMLDKFCTNVVTLNASNNAISHLDGVPQTVRNLCMTHNVLSELTAWSQLMNLQYVDVSNNQLTSLSAFKDLVHLRTLRADNNQITNLDGIKFHDSLQVLRARGNLIKHVDFDGTRMQRLTELDLENNQIVAFENVEQLTCLSTLNLENNCLTSFSPSEGQSSLSLRFLKLSNNDLEYLDVTALPSLRLLHADRNSITTITGFSQCRRLDSLSLREQKGNMILDTSFLDSACEVRKLFLSGNRLSGFNPQVDFLNLQYLELANCGLESLAPEIGQLMPNLRMLNINFNAIDDLWPLRYIPRLKKLLAVGNRLVDARKIANTLAEFPHLSRLDLRGNGATLGFYAPVQSLVSTEGDGKEAESDPFVLPDVDVERQEKFASRLDLGTRMRKRVYDMVVLNDCRQLKMLDGLPVSKDTVSSRDDIWKALLENGIIEVGGGGEGPDVSTR
ncbi:hypothetical protein F5Y14DRAFT_410506 [Nemania sp. NC0429]|nr:hypothetical protein F5Y14DRAFT_410506 [Nemania sp. NC0429]